MVEGVAEEAADPPSQERTDDADEARYGVRHDAPAWAPRKVVHAWGSFPSGKALRVCEGRPGDAELRRGGREAAREVARRTPRSAFSWRTFGSPESAVDAGTSSCESWASTRSAEEAVGMARTHYFPEDRVHYVWNNELEPALEVEPGDTVVYRTREVSDGQISPDSTADALASFDWDRVYPLAGPVRVRGAEPGDVLEVEVVDIHTLGWGWTAVIPGFGLLSEDFPDAYLKIFDLTTGDYTLFKDDVAVPIDPFFGTMGVSPADTTEKPVIMPPGPFGGNMDTRHITKGARLYLPVQVSGALFSCGDAHAAQGDGEVCVTGIESPMYAALRFGLIKGRSLPAPQFVTPGSLTPKSEGAGWYATMGVNPDLMQATKDSLRAMVEHVSTTYHMEPVEAYVLASLAVDLKISEVVDQPNWIVSSYLPLSIFR